MFEKEKGQTTMHVFRKLTEYSLFLFFEAIFLLFFFLKTREDVVIKATRIITCLFLAFMARVKMMGFSFGFSASLANAVLFEPCCEVYNNIRATDDMFSEPVN